MSFKFLMALQLLWWVLTVISPVWNAETQAEDKYSTHNFLLRQYYGCLYHSEKIVKELGEKSSHAVTVVSDTHALLTCLDCVNPFPSVPINISSYFWRFRGIKDNNFNDIQFAEDEETIAEAGRSGWIRDANGDVLIVGATQERQAGDYLCLHRDTFNIVNYWHVSVVEDRPYRVVTKNLKREYTGMRPLEPHIDLFYNIKVLTKWTVWSDCDKCGLRGNRFKMGYCTVTKNRPDVDYDDLKVLSEALNRFSEGIPCQSTRLPREVRDIPEIKNRLDEQMMEMCSIECPAEEEKVEYYEEAGKIKSRQYPKGFFSISRRRPEIPPKVRRLTYELVVGSQVALVCPTVSMTFDHSISIKSIEMEDSGLYSCYNYDNFLLLVVDLHAREPNMGSIFSAWLSMITFSSLLFYLSTYILRLLKRSYFPPEEEEEEEDEGEGEVENPDENEEDEDE